MTEQLAEIAKSTIDAIRQADQRRAGPPSTRIEPSEARAGATIKAAHDRWRVIYEEYDAACVALGVAEREREAASKRETAAQRKVDDMAASLDVIEREIVETPAPDVRAVAIKMRVCDDWGTDALKLSLANDLLRLSGLTE